MLLEHFKLFEQPFGVTPDPRFLYLGEQHREALASLVYTTDSNRGFVAMIAQPGMGKTSLLYNYLEMLRNRARTAFVFRTDCNAREFIRHVLLDLGIDSPMNDLPAMHDALNRVLMEEHRANRRFVLVIDEAQNLSEDVLESIRLLSNFETPWMKLMHIVLAGQPQLAEHLAKPSMMQLRQRISQIIRIEPFSLREVNAYMDRRLQAAGCRDLSIFTDGARSAITELSGGIPRNINNICFNALSLACATKRNSVDRRTVAEVMSDLVISLTRDGETSLPEQPDERVQREIHARSRRENKGHGLMGWIPRFSLTVLFVAIFAMAFGIERRGLQQTVVDDAMIGEISSADPASTIDPARKPEGTSTAGDLSSATRAAPRAALVVVPGQTLIGISHSELGRYDTKTLTEIQKLNPWMTDPNLIPVGQELLLPHSNGSSKTARRTAAPSGASILPKQVQ